MYKTTKEDLEASWMYKNNPESQLVANVVNRLLDKYLVDALKKSDVLYVKVTTPEPELDVLVKRVVQITLEEFEFVKDYTGRLIDLVDQPFLDYVESVYIVPDNGYLTFVFGLRKSNLVDN